MFYHPTLIELNARAHVLELHQTAAAGQGARRLRALWRRNDPHGRPAPSASPSPSRRAAQSDS